MRVLEGEGDSNATIGKKQSKAKKLQKKNKNHVSTAWDARIMLDKMNATQFRRAWSKELRCVIRVHLDRFRSADESTRVSFRVNPLGSLWDSADWDRMMLYFDVAPNQHWLGFDPSACFPLVTFQLRRSTDQMAVGVRYPPDTVALRVPSDIVKIQCPALYGNSSRS